MTSPTPVREKLWVKLLFYPALIFIGLPALVVWVGMHLVGLSFICDCAVIPSPDWAFASRWFGAIVVMIPLLLADWFVIWKWRDHRRKEKWAKKYAAEHQPWYAKTGSDRPTTPIKNEPYEP